MSAIAKAVSTPAHPLHLKAGLSTSGWLAVLLLFVLAHLFAQGAQMRERLDVERGKDAASFGAICEKNLVYQRLAPDTLADLNRGTRCWV